MEVRRTPETRHDNAPSFLQSPRLDPTAVAIEDTGSSVARLAAWKAERAPELVLERTLSRIPVVKGGSRRCTGHSRAKAGGGSTGRTQHKLLNAPGLGPEQVSEEAPAFNWYCGYRNVNTN